MNRRENGKLWRHVVKNLIISDNQAFLCLIINPFDNHTPGETVTSHSLSRSVILPKTRLKVLIVIIKSRYQPKLICYLVVEERPRHLDFDPPTSTQTGIQEARGWIQLCQVVQESYTFRDPSVSPSDTLLLSPLQVQVFIRLLWTFRSVRTGGITTGSDTVSSSRLSTNPIIGSSDHERLETLDGHHCLFSKHQDDRAISLPHSTDDSCYHWMKKTWIPGLPQTTLIRLFWHMRWWWSNLEEVLLDW